MNLVDCFVTKILSLPYEMYGKWWVKVEYDCYGSSQKTSLMFNTKEEAEKIETGYKFLA